MFKSTCKKPLLGAGIAFTITLNFSAAFAGAVEICNTTKSEVRVAAAVEQFFSRSWGWERVRVGQCKDVVGRFNGGYIYFYIEFLADTFSKFNNVQFTPQNAKNVNYCVNLESNFDYLYNNKGCKSGMISKKFFEAYSDTGNYSITIN